MNQAEVNRRNAEFWDELCGSTFAQTLGIKDHSLESLKKFDDAYFEYYPYLLKHVPVETMKDKRVMEVGLGYGTLGMKIAQSCGDYIGLDIAPGPVSMMNHRLELYGLPGKAIQGSILECPLEDNSLDCVVSIGCYHHTGNIAQCINETYRVLKPGGWAYLMLYNQFSYRQWNRWPRETFKALMCDLKLSKDMSDINDDQRLAYDANTTGKGAPETVFTSIAQIKKMFDQFSLVKCTKENCDEFFTPLGRLPRRAMLPILGKFLGLDIYIAAQK